MLSIVISAVLAIAGIGFTAVPAAFATDAPPAYPYDVTFVWQLGADSTPEDPFADTQTLVAWQYDKDASSVVPSYAQACDITYQIDHYRITSDADQATLDQLVSTGELASPIDSTIGYNWSRAHSGNPYWSYEPENPVECVAPEPPLVTQAQCVEGGPATAPFLRFADTPGISYSSTGDVGPGKTVIITATPNLGHELTPADGWTLNADGPATYTLTFDTPNCATEVTPVAPTVEQAVCVDGGPATAPTLMLATTPGITYSTAGEVAAGATVTVTATPDADRTLTSADGWTAQDDGTATYTGTFTTPECTGSTGTPVAPVVTQAVCTGPGDASTPTLTFTTNEDITYTVEGTPAPGATVTVVATPAEGYTLTAAPGWTAHADGTAKFAVTFTTPDCTVSVTPVTPTATPAVCVEGSTTVTPPALMLPTTTGVTYTTTGTVAAGGTLVVTATPSTGYALATTPGWTAAEDGTATRNVEFAAAPTCVAATPTPTPTPSASASASASVKPNLAATGAADLTPLALGALGLLVAGAAALIVRRRQKSDAS